MRQALLWIDLQYDFCPGGALAVREGDAVLPLANALAQKFSLVLATQDWHPPSHLSFASNHAGKAAYDQIELDGLPQVLWPDHCVQGTHGAQLHASLDLRRVAHVVQKGTDPRIDSYSGFFDNGHRKSTTLHSLLQGEGVRELTLLGLATDYCVRWTALDAVRLGYRVTLVPDACRAVNLAAGDDQQALRELSDAGVALKPSSELLI